MAPNRYNGITNIGIHVLSSLIVTFLSSLMQVGLGLLHYYHLRWSVPSAMLDVFLMCNDVKIETVKQPHTCLIDNIHNFKRMLFFADDDSPE